jgi:predicted nucleic acid-binding protein
MQFLLDTCVVSDGAKPRHFPRLADWLAARGADEAAISALTVGELRYGVERLPAGRKRAELLTWLEVTLMREFAGRVLPLDDRVADAWGVLRAAGEAAGRPLPIVDGMLLATAQAHGLIFVTRNEAHVTGRGVGVLNPY